ncbi:LamG-like jellyroll fold domain-containing protein [Archangium violaceum]|uniref:LamG-like jellyroll fold domain-containing protein n=1 Tax=Archangium violaceum TaxID=83451 RepID=UPI0036DE0DBA
MRRALIRTPLCALLSGLMLLACGVPESEEAPPEELEVGTRESAMCSGASVSSLTFSALSSYQGEVIGMGNWKVEYPANAVFLEYYLDGVRYAYSDRTPEEPVNNREGSWHFSQQGIACGSHTLEVRAWPVVLSSTGRDVCGPTPKTISQSYTEPCQLSGDLGSALGAKVVSASTCGATNNLKPSCVSNSSAPERIYAWTAPYSGTFTFTTVGASYDTVLQLYNPATGATLGCNDDSNGTLQSSVTVTVSAGQRLELGVDGYGSACGAFQVNVFPVSGTGLKLWLSGSAGVTSSGGRVSAWLDHSGNRRDATISDAARQPYLINSALNGKPVLRFAGAQSLVFSSLMQLSRPTVFVVAKNNKSTESFHMILGPAGTSANHQLRFENGSQVLLVTPGTYTSTVGNNRAYHTLAVRYDGSAWNVFRDGVLKSTHASTSSATWDLYQVGAWFGQYFLEGDIAEIIAYDRALSDSELGTVSSYLRGRYALP